MDHRLLNRLRNDPLALLRLRAAQLLKAVFTPPLTAIERRELVRVATAPCEKDRLWLSGFDTRLETYEQDIEEYPNDDDD